MRAHSLRLLWPDFVIYTCSISQNKAPLLSTHVILKINLSELLFQYPDILSLFLLQNIIYDTN